MAMNPVDRYAYQLSGMCGSEEVKRGIVKKIRQAGSEEEAVEFFKKATKPPSIGRWLFYDEPAQRRAIADMQDYLRETEVEVPAPNKLVQRFLNGGKYPVKRR